MATHRVGVDAVIHGLVYHADALELLEDWAQEGVEVTHTITDPPYSVRTHRGLRTSERPDGASPTEADYDHLEPGDADHLARLLHEVTHGWIVILTDHVLAPVYEAALEDCGRYVFSPLACVVPHSRIRLAGDGPSQWSCWAVVSRPRTAEYARWGTLPGAYVCPREQLGRTGGKTYSLMSQLVRDYSRPGDVVLDPMCGAGTTLRAAADLERLPVGIEIDLGWAEYSRQRLAQGVMKLEAV